MNELKAVLYATASLAGVELIEEQAEATAQEEKPAILVSEDQEGGGLKLQKVSGATLTVTKVAQGDSWVIVAQHDDGSHTRLIIRRRSALLYILNFVLARD